MVGWKMRQSLPHAYLIHVHGPELHWVYISGLLLGRLGLAELLLNACVIFLSSMVSRRTAAIMKCRRSSLSLSKASRLGSRSPSGSDASISSSFSCHSNFIRTART